MIPTNTIPARAAMVATIAAICFAVAACGTEQGGAMPDQESQHTAQHAAADDVAAQVEYRKTARTQETGEMGRQQHAVADDVVRWVEQRKSAHGTH